MSHETKEDTMSTHINQITLSDLDQVIPMGFKTPEFQTGTDAAQFYSRETLGRWIRDENGVTLVARVGDNFAGFILGYYMPGPNDGYLNCLVVNENYRNKGVGSKLLDEALTEFEKKGGGRCNHVFGVVKPDNEPTLKLLQKHGFQIGETFRYVETMLPPIRE